MSDVSQLSIELWMPLDHYVAISFGGTHINSDMICFVTSQSNIHTVFDMYSSTWDDPVMDDNDDLEWLVSNDDYPLIKFSVIRSLDTGDIQDYAVALEEVTRMGFAIRNSGVLEEDNGGVVRFGGHTRHGFFDMIVHEYASDVTENTSYWPVYVN